MARVEIFRFEAYDIHEDKWKASTRWGTRFGIARLGGKPIEVSRHTVSISEMIFEVDEVSAAGYMPVQRK